MTYDQPGGQPYDPNRPWEPSPPPADPWAAPVSGNPYATPASGAPYADPASGVPYADPNAPWGVQGTAAGGYPPGAYPPAMPYLVRRTNSLAIVAMIIALAVCGPAGAIMGHIARKQCKERNEDGEGFALAAIIIGWITTGLIVLVCGFYAIVVVIAIIADAS